MSINSIPIISPITNIVKTKRGQNNRLIPLKSFFPPLISLASEKQIYPVTRYGRKNKSGSYLSRKKAKELTKIFIRKYQYHAYPL